MVRWTAPGGRTTGGGTQVNLQEARELAKAGDQQAASFAKGTSAGSRIGAGVESTLRDRIDSKQAVEEVVADDKTLVESDDSDDVIITGDGLGEAGKTADFDVNQFAGFQGTFSDATAMAASQNFFSGLGGELGEDFAAAFDIGGNQAPDWSVQPKNAAEAQHLQSWLRHHNPGVIADEEGMLTYNGLPIQPGELIPTGLEEALGYDIGVDSNQALSPAGYAQLKQDVENFAQAEVWADTLVQTSFDSQQTAWEMDLSVNANEQLKIVDDTFAQNMAFLKAQYDEQLNKISGAEARKAARVTGEESRASLTHEYNLRQTELEDEHSRGLERLETERINMLEKIKVQMEAEKSLYERQHELDLDVKEAELEFKAEQEALDRALAQGQLDEVVRHNQNLEILDSQKNALAKDQLKVEMVTTIANNPAFLFYAKQSGMLNILADALGGTDSANEMYEALVGFVPEDTKQSNIQGFNRMSAVEQSLETFAISARKGLTTAQQNRELVSGAPIDPRQQARYVRPEIRPGRGADPNLFNFSSEEQLGTMETAGGSTVQRVGDTESVLAGRQPQLIQPAPAAEEPAASPRAKVGSSATNIFSDPQTNDYWGRVKASWPDMTLETFMLMKHIPNLDQMTAADINRHAGSASGQQAGAATVREKRGRDEAWERKWNVRV